MSAELKKASKSWRIVFSLLAPSIFLISGAFSALGIYDFHHESNEVFALILAGIIFGISLIFSLSIAYFTFLSKEVSPRFTLVILITCIGWLGVSPTLNLMILAMPKVISMEIADRSQSLTKVIDPLGLRIEAVNKVLLPALESQISESYNEVERQSTKALGGCRSICSSFEVLATELTYLYDKLSLNFSEKNFKKIQNTIPELRSLALSNDRDWQTKINSYNYAAVDVSRFIRSVIIAGNPADLIKYAIDRIENAQSKLNSQHEGIRINLTTKLAWQSAKGRYKRILRLLKDTHSKFSRKLIDTSELSFAFATPLIPNTQLLFKHIMQFPDLLIIAWFIDTLGILIVLSSIIAHHISTRN